MSRDRRLQRHFGDGFVTEAVEDLWEPWMRHADTAFEDDALLLIIQQELAKRCKKSKTRGRKATSAEVVLRMLLLKHVRNWSYETLSREVRANLVYREFTRIGGEKVPDDRTMGNLARLWRTGCGRASACPPARASRNKTEQGRQKMKNAYVQLLEITSRVAGQAKKFPARSPEHVKQGNLSILHKAKKQLDEMVPRVQQVLRQTLGAGAARQHPGRRKASRRI